MAYRGSARATARRIRMRRVRAAVLLVIVSAIVAALGYQTLTPWSSRASSSSASASPIGATIGEYRRVLGEPDGVVPGSATIAAPRRTLGEPDGAVPSGTTVFDDAVPGVANLDPDLLGALRRAARDAEGDGVEFIVDSGWRSAEYQEQLLREAVSKYGSAEEAARWVATPKASAHVSGDAVDIGPGDAAAWLSRHGAAYGLCQIYANEPWHFELRHEAIEHGCPPAYADPSHDPRLQA